MDANGQTSWRVTGVHAGTCNCIWSCPCQFNALPDKGYCEAILAWQINDGHFGETSLDGVRFGFAVHWPGAIHDGNGTRQCVVDEGASGISVKTPSELHRPPVRLEQATPGLRAALGALEGAGAAASTATPRTARFAKRSSCRRRRPPVADSAGRGSTGSTSPRQPRTGASRSVAPSRRPESSTRATRTRSAGRRLRFSRTSTGGRRRA